MQRSRLDKHPHPRLILQRPPPIVSVMCYVLAEKAQIITAPASPAYSPTSPQWSPSSPAQPQQSRSTAFQNRTRSTLISTSTSKPCTRPPPTLTSTSESYGHTRIVHTHPHHHCLRHVRSQFHYPHHQDLQSRLPLAAWFTSYIHVLLDTSTYCST
jgi:hypothetical protein